MSRILLVDDSPHAQRIGERILSDEGYEVVTVSNADTALVRIEDVDPDIVIADAVMPGRNGYDICQYLKMSPRHRHVRVILTAGVLEPIDEAQASRVESDACIKKPFEASALINAVKPLAEAAAEARKKQPAASGATASDTAAKAQAIAPFVAVVDEEQVRAAVTVALDGAMDAIVGEIARRVVATFQAHPPESALSKVGASAAPSPELAPAVAPAPSPVRMEPVRRIHPLRVRTPILGLDADVSEEDASESRPPDSD